MRVLIADRNGRLLEAISRSFAQRFVIQTATTHELCNELLQQGAFDLTVISEKLADGRGLQLLGQIARNSPDTLRVFAARRSRLQLLKGKLEPFGLLRTLTYPIDPQQLLSVLTLAQADLETRAPAPETRNVPGALISAPAALRPVLERISRTSADALCAINVPMTIASMERARLEQIRLEHARLERVRRSEVSPTPLPAPIARPQDLAPQPTISKSATPQPAAESRLTAPLRSPSQGVAFQPTPVRHKPANAAVGIEVDPRFSQRAHVPAQRVPLRTKLALAATMAVVFLVTTLTINLNDANLHVAQASTPRPVIAPPVIPTPPPEPTPAVSTAFAPTAPKRVPPKPPAPTPEEDPLAPQMTASTTPVAEPSSFGSEAYEPIYSN